MLTLHQSQPATQDDILRLCESFHALTRQVIKDVLAEVRRGSGRRGGVGYAADDESEEDIPRPRLSGRGPKYRGERRRPPEENLLSVYFFISLFSIANLGSTESHSCTYEGVISR